eukprot:778854-Rhodomonas_salina.3
MYVVPGLCYGRAGPAPYRTGAGTVPTLCAYAYLLAAAIETVQVRAELPPPYARATRPGTNLPHRRRAVLVVWAYARATRCPVLTERMVRRQNLCPRTKGRPQQVPVGLRACYAMSGTDIAYAYRPTHALCHSRY